MFRGDNSSILSSPSFHKHSNSSATAEQEDLVVKVMKFLLYAFVFVVGLGGNFIVIFVTKRRKKVRTFHNILLCNLAVADIALLSMNLPFRLAYQENNYVWPFGDILCKIIPMLMYLFLNASSLTLVALSYERYRTISSLKIVSETVSLSRKLQLVFFWVLSFLITLPLNLFLTVVVRRGNEVCTDIWPSESLERVYFTTLLLIQFALPTIVMIMVYIKVGIILRKNRYKLRRLGLSHNRSKHRKVSTAVESRPQWGEGGRRRFNILAFNIRLPTARHSNGTSLQNKTPD